MRYIKEKYNIFKNLIIKMNKALNVVFAIALILTVAQSSLFESDNSVNRFGGLKAI